MPAQTKDEVQAAEKLLRAKKDIVEQLGTVIVGQ